MVCREKPVNRGARTPTLDGVLWNPPPGNRQKKAAKPLQLSEDEPNLNLANHLLCDIPTAVSASEMLVPAARLLTEVIDE